MNLPHRFTKIAIYFSFLLILVSDFLYFKDIIYKNRVYALYFGDCFHYN